MTASNQSNLTNPDLWIRLVYMIVFWLLSWVARLAVAVIGAIQFVLLMVNGETNAKLRSFGEGVAIWTEQSYRFVCFVSEQKPYPFQDWPQTTVDAIDEVEPIEPIEEVAQSPENEALADTDDDADSSRQQKPGSGFDNIRD